MHAWEIGEASGDPSGPLALRAVERPIPTPGPGEVLIAVGATALNARDLWFMRRKGDPRRVPCSDNVGRIAAVGAGVTRVAVGERVIVNHYARWSAGDWDVAYEDYDMGDNVDGFLAEYALAPAAATVRIPDRLPDTAACTLVTAGLTAFRALAIEGLPLPGQTVLTLGTGGVSVFGLQVAKMMGARVVITSSSDEKLARMQALGADFTANYRTTPDWPKEVVRLTGGRGVDVVLNNVGYPEIESCLLACACEARVIHIGTSPKKVEINPLANFFTKGCSIKGIANGSHRMLEQFVAAAESGGLVPVVDRVFPFAQAREAVAAMEGTDRVGKLAIDIAGGRSS
jgi:NADPH:quinone reductase-like Zn-dependent oxidoreductase